MTEPHSRGAFLRAVIAAACLFVVAAFAFAPHAHAAARHHRQHAHGHHHRYYHHGSMRHGHHRRLRPHRRLDRHAGYHPRWSGLETVRSAFGPITVSPEFAPRILPFIRALADLGVRIRRVGCYASTGHIRNSLHYTGNACDFDQRGRNLTIAAMYRLGDLAARFGLRNGCSFGDCGHIDNGLGPLPRNPFFPRNYFARRSIGGYGS